MNTIKLILLYSIFIVVSTINAQNRIITGTVTDTLQKPLDYASVLAIPNVADAKMQYGTTDETGKFTLEIDANFNYELSVSYIGFHTQKKVVAPNDGVKKVDFRLVQQENQLDEIIIDYDYQPIVVKKDTVIYNVNAFTNGNERKLKDALEKLPGVEVNTNGDVLVQGKKVTQLQVEGKKFFGGGSKLAVENIPADAVDKVEVVDNFVEVGFLKKVSSSDDLAMNIKLKEDKKKFVFGDVQAGAEMANDNKFYLANAALFYYSPKTAVNFIADANSIGKRIFSYADLQRFEGGVSSYITKRKPISNLGSFSSENKDVKENSAQFVALSLQQTITKKIDLISYGVFSKVFLKNQSETSIEYMQPNQTSIFENSASISEQKNTLGLWNTKLNWTPNKKHQIFYNFNLKLGKKNYNQQLQTISTFNPNSFSIQDKISDTDFKQYLEWHQDISSSHLMTFVLNHSYTYNKPENTWVSTNPFLIQFLPIQNANSYRIAQILKTKEHIVDALLKNYWILSYKSQLNLNIGNSVTKSKITSSTFQQLNNSLQYDFNTAGFYNDLNYRLNDFFVGLEYKLKIGKLSNTASIYWHQYNIAIKQSLNSTISKGIWLPDWLSEYEFKSGKKFRLVYKMQTSFATANQMAEGKYLSSYSSVYKGNALQSNEIYHNLNANMYKVSLYKGFTYFLAVSYLKKDNTRRNEVIFDGINRYITTVLTNLPEKRAAFSGSVSKNIWKLNAGISGNMNWGKYHQNIDGIDSQYDRNSQNFGVNMRTLFDKFPEIRLNYNKGINQLNGQQKTNYQTDTYTAAINYNFFNHFIVDASYEKFMNHSAFATNADYSILNASLRYHKKDNPWVFEIMAQNILGNNEKIANSISDYAITETKYYILPRMLMLVVHYKL